jgi:hypothetical protein
MVRTQVSEDVRLYVVFWRAGTGIVGLVTRVQHVLIEDCHSDATNLARLCWGEPDTCSQPSHRRL